MTLDEKDLFARHSTLHVTPVEAFREALGDERVLYSKGCDVHSTDESGFEAATRVAKAAEVAVVVIAERSGLGWACTVGEGRDSTDLRLTGIQTELVREVSRTGTPTVVVVLSGRVHALEEIADVAGAIIQFWPPGEEGGNGLVDVLLGTVNPAGRLPVSLPRTAGQIPVYTGQRAPRGQKVGSGGYADGPAAPVFPFGHGLSYTTFAYDNFDVSAGSTSDVVLVRVQITNAGAVVGDEVVQLYASDVVASLPPPERQLIGFLRLSVKPAETYWVEFVVHPSRLAFCDVDLCYVCEPGEYIFRVGSSSVDIRAEATVSLLGPLSVYRQRDIVATQVSYQLA
jgi:beta-glucosidase